ncbi:recombinase family protein [Quadrisphaera sp. INWT6]|uniref:recombinase family protein n=1 Tax=Quadrisphaera sp. INWT6 TaxID=2596917 RepID=UPI00189218B2|nr:recombinase family protein [Quadrisphaera sp. INWT6]MBF5081381.1 recombinase family protein [Quadrisphaera sp. INWT6]
MPPPAISSQPVSAVVYLRISQDRVGEEAGVTRQREDCARRCAERGWTVVAVEEDNDMSAKSGRRRPGFEALLRHLDHGRATVVVAWTLDRLQRNKRDEIRLYETCQSRGAMISLVRGPDLDLTTPGGRMMADTFGTQARYEVDVKGDRQKRANSQRRDAGLMGWTRRPFGYDRCPEGQVFVVEEEAAGLREAAAITLAGGTLAAAVRALDARGLTSTLGKPFTTITLRRLLLSPRHAGRVTFMGADHGVAGTWPAIFTEEQQQRLTEVLADPRRRMAQSTEPRYLLSGVARCGQDGSIMRGSPMVNGERRWHVYKCSVKGCRRARRSDLVDAVVVAEVLRVFKENPDLFTPNEDVSDLRAAAADLRERRDALGDLLADGLMSATKVRERALLLTRELEGIEARIGRAVADSPASPLVGAVDPAAVWEVLPVGARKAVVNLLMTVEIMPAGKGARFTPEQVRMTMKGAGAGD